MIKLMDISETAEIMDLWRKEMKKLTGLDEDINDFSETLEEALGHANVYVAHKDQDIIGFSSVLEGFYISDIFYSDETTGTELINELKSKYDELQIDLHHKHKANHLLPNLGFTKLGHSEHDTLGFEELQYEWLKDE